MRRSTLPARPTSSFEPSLPPAQDEAPTRRPQPVTLPIARPAQRATAPAALAPSHARLSPPAGPRRMTASIPPVPLPPPLQTESFADAAWQAQLGVLADDIMADVCGLPPSTLDRLVGSVSPSQLTAAFSALDRSLALASLRRSPSDALAQLLGHEGTAYSPAAPWTAPASVVHMGAPSAPAYLLSSHPEGEEAAYLASLWQRDVAVVASLASTSFWPAPGCRARFGAIEVATERVCELSVRGLGAPMVVRTCQLTAAAQTRRLHVVHVPWRDFAALSCVALREVVWHVERLRTGRGLAIHCAAGLGRSGTFALAHAMLADGGQRTIGQLLVGFLQLRLQRRGTIERVEQFASIVDALRLPAQQ